MMDLEDNPDWEFLPRAMNNGFWDRDPEDRSARMEAACERAGIPDFFDLSPEERAAAYDSE